MIIIIMEEPRHKAVKISYAIRVGPPDPPLTLTAWRGFRSFAALPSWLVYDNKTQQICPCTTMVLQSLIWGHLLAFTTVVSWNRNNMMPRFESRDRSILLLMCNGGWILVAQKMYKQ